MIDAKGSERTPLCFIKTHRVQKGNIYHASCWVKIEGVSDEAVVGIVIKWHDANSKWLGEVHLDLKCLGHRFVARKLFAVINSQRMISPGR